MASSLTLNKLLYKINEHQNTAKSIFLTMASAPIFTLQGGTPNTNES